MSLYVCVVYNTLKITFLFLITICKEKKSWEGKLSLGILKLTLFGSKQT